LASLHFHRCLHLVDTIGGFVGELVGGWVGGCVGGL
uniref:Uncharacterized protein n=1 Tax=Ciona intestinalis TaxID=7719 RepID=F6V2D9_CIOIN